MQDILSQAMGLKRPNILVRAARFGLTDYNRERHLQRCLPGDQTLTPGRALVALLDAEKQLNSDRCKKAGTYVIARHVDVLTAIMAEAESFRRMTHPGPQLVSG